MTDVSLPGPVPQILASKYPNQTAWPDKEQVSPLLCIYLFEIRDIRKTL